MSSQPASTDVIRRALNPRGGLDVNVGGNPTAFGEAPVAQFLTHCGWSFAYNINPFTMRTFALNGGAVTYNRPFADISSGTSPDGFAFLRTNAKLSYTPGIGAVARFSAIFDTPQPNSTQLIGIGDNFDGWFFGYDGLDFGVTRRRDGVDNWTYMDDWSENAWNDTGSKLNQQKGNIYEIRFQWLGFGMQYFGIEDARGKFRDVHRIAYANKHDLPSVSNPSVGLTAGVSNDGNTTSVTLKTASAVGGSHGERFPRIFTSLLGYSRTLDITGDGNIIFALRNPPIWQGADNRTYSTFPILSIATNGNKPVIFKIIFNAVLTDPVWSSINEDVAAIEVDTAATGYSNGIEVINVVLGADDSKVLDTGALLDDQKLWADSNVLLLGDAEGTSEVTVSTTIRSRT